MQDLGINITQSLQLNKFADDLVACLETEESTKEMCDKISNYLFVIRTDDGFKLLLDLESPPLSDEIAKQKQEKFEELLRHEDGRSDDNKIELEIKDI